MPEKNEKLGREEVLAEEHSFDELAKGVADDTLPRGKALKSAFAAVVAGVLGVFALPPREAEARPLKTLWAVVNADGTLVRGKGVVNVFKGDLANYEITFNRDVSTCAKTATINGYFSPPGEIFVKGQASNRVILVSTYNHDGNSANRGFSLVVNC
jgi:hypothetical protein